MGHAQQTLTMAIIAAGEGSRLKREGVETPKPLVAICGEPMIMRLMRMGIRHGVEQIHVVVNESSPAVLHYLTQQISEIPLNIVIRSTPSSMHSLFALEPFLHSGPFLLATVDSIFRESEFAAFLTVARATAADGMLGVTHFIDDEKPLCVVTDDEGRVVQFSDTAEGCTTATGGLYWFSPRIFDEIPAALKAEYSRLRNFLRLLLNRSYDLRTFTFSKMIDVDHASDVAAAEALVAEDAPEPIAQVRMHT